MTSPFLSEVQGSLSSAEQQLLTECNIRSADELYSFAMTFSEYDGADVDITKLSDLGARRSSGSVFAVGQSIQTKGPRKFPLGVTDTHAPVSVGGTMPPKSSPGRLASPRLVDNRLPGWQVRDQGDRGTCVAHALVAAREHGCPARPLSPQFLFWATKTTGHDPFPQSDGSRLEYAHQALATEGVCEDSHWPYDGQELPGDVAHVGGSDPSQAALANAKQHRRNCTYYQGATRGGAKLLLDELSASRAPVAISVPVFASVGTQSFTNWNTPVAEVHGCVIDPPPRSIVVGAHAVCVTGFSPDPHELMGGYFVFRNSWGLDWGRAAPDPSVKPKVHTPEPGYGQISATYVEKYLWELCRVS